MSDLLPSSLSSEATPENSPPVTTPQDPTPPATSSTVPSVEAAQVNPAQAAAAMTKEGIPTEILHTLQAALSPIVSEIEHKLESYDGEIKDWTDSRLRDALVGLVDRLEQRFAAFDARITANTGALLGAGIAVQGHAPPASAG